MPPKENQLLFSQTVGTYNVTKVHLKKIQLLKKPPAQSYQKYITFSHL